ncbi:hypothetical protein VTH06DRAFT_8506 [Thermothelomyces fergusii]
MKLNRALRFLVLGLSAISVAEATFGGMNVSGRDVKGLQRRQDDEDGAPTDSTDSDPVTSTTPPEEPPTTSSSEEPTSEPETSTSNSPSPPTTTSSPPTTTPTTTRPPPVTSNSEPPKPPPTSTSSDEPEPTPTNPPDQDDNNNNDNNDNNDGGNGDDDDDDDAPDTTSSSSRPQPTNSPTKQPEPTTFTITHIITTTRDDGSPVTYTSETKTTQTPGLVDPGSDDEPSSGMSTQTRNTVIGVVVGVGGAIVLGGLALVAWRIWGRKKPQEESDGLMDYNSAIESKPDSGGPGAARSPFQSTLESYHAPTQVNTAANF